MNIENTTINPLSAELPLDLMAISDIPDFMDADTAVCCEHFDSIGSEATDDSIVIAAEIVATEIDNPVLLADSAGLDIGGLDIGTATPAEPVITDILQEAPVINEPKQLTAADIVNAVLGGSSDQLAPGIYTQLLDSKASAAYLVENLDAAAAILESGNIQLAPNTFMQLLDTNREIVDVTFNRAFNVDVLSALDDNVVINQFGANEFYISFGANKAIVSNTGVEVYNATTGQFEQLADNVGDLLDQQLSLGDLRLNFTTDGDNITGIDLGVSTNVLASYLGEDLMLTGAALFNGTMTNNTVISLQNAAQFDAFTGALTIAGLISKSGVGTDFLLSRLNNSESGFDLKYRAFAANQAVAAATQESTDNSYLAQLFDIALTHNSSRWLGNADSVSPTNFQDMMAVATPQKSSHWLGDTVPTNFAAMMNTATPNNSSHWLGNASEFHSINFQDLSNMIMAQGSQHWLGSSSNVDLTNLLSVLLTKTLSDSEVAVNTSTADTSWMADPNVVGWLQSGTRS